MSIRSFLLLAAALAGLTLPARAEVTFPTGSRVGLELPPGIAVSRDFVGFEDAQNKVLMLVAELPPQAYESTLKSMSQAGKGGAGTTDVKREILLTRSGAAHVIAGNQQADKQPTRKWILLTPSAAQDFVALVTVIVPQEARKTYPDAKVREILSTVTLRGDVPNEEILALLPFRVTELADFKSVRSLAIGRAVILTDALPESDLGYNGPKMLLAAGPGAPLEPGERARFAEQLFATLPGLKDTRGTFSEPQRIDGAPGHESRMEGKDAATGADVVVVQWVRFGLGSFARLVGMAPKDQWQAAFARFRSVRDGIDFRK